MRPISLSQAQSSPDAAVAESAPPAQEGSSPPARFLLVLNAGSSSLKFGLFSEEPAPSRVLSGSFDRLHAPTTTFHLRQRSAPAAETRTLAKIDLNSCLDYILQTIAEFVGTRELAAVGHRVVHGGSRYSAPTRVNADLVSELNQLRPFAPEHLPPAIAIIERLQQLRPSLPQVACFDTAFHRALPRVAALLPLPRRYEAAGVRRYGFHGLSYESLMQQLEQSRGPDAANGRLILAHLGNGASLAAVRNRQSIDTSMSFTPSAGLVMATRTGDLDPGLFPFLARAERISPEAFDHLINRQSGLLGISELSSDMRELLNLDACDSRASDAIELFCYQAKKWIGSFAAALGGLDTLVFSGGIGENQPAVRKRICTGLEFLGLELDDYLNSSQAHCISTKTSSVTVHVMHTDEELVIAQAVSRLLNPDQVQKQSTQ